MSGGSPARGRLLLLPVPVDTRPPTQVLPPATVAAIVPLRRFVVENARSARRVLAQLPMEVPIRELSIEVFDEHTDPALAPLLVAALSEGESIGVMSEAGCPGIADPGAPLVRAAHAAGCDVVPLVGPSAILMALMASGLEGQRFAFHGYLPTDPAGRDAALSKLERRAADDRATQCWIETPYRSDAMLAAAAREFADSTWLSLAVDLGAHDGWVATRPAARWRATSLPVIGKRPTVFLVGVDPVTARAAPNRRS